METPGETGLPPVSVADLERWADAGAQWRVVEVHAGRAVIDLCACTGEAVERRETTDAAVIAYVSSARRDT